MEKMWENLPTDKILTEEELKESLFSIVEEWLKEDRDESVRSRELWLIRRIEELYNGAVKHKRSFNKLLELYVKIGDDKEAIEIACNLIGKTPEEAGAGSFAAQQVLEEIKNWDQ